MHRGLMGLILVLLIFLCIPHSQGQERSQTAGELYDSGMALYHKARYEEAIDRFSKLILFFPTSKLNSYSRLMIGQCYVKMQKDEESVLQD